MTNELAPPSRLRTLPRAMAAILTAVLASAVLAGPTAAAPGDRVVCPGTFQVLHDDRIGKLELPAGAYRITVRRMSCPDASDKFRRFLSIPSGNLPDNWEVRPNRAKFRNAVNGQSFRVKRTGN
jgi:hypothetical protein